MGNKKRIHIWGRFPLDNCDTNEIIKKLARWAGNKKGRKTVFYANIHQLRLFREDEKFRKALMKADLVWPDGMGVIIAGYLSGHGIIARSVATDYYPILLPEWVKRDRKIFFLGGNKNTVEKAVKKTCRSFSGLRIVGFHHGFFSNTKTVINKILTCKPDVLVVGMGSPKQETWVEENKNKLKGVRLIWVVGGLFNYWSGDWTRAPKPMTKYGFEWMFRLFTEPKRMFSRYILGAFSLLIQAITYKLNRNIERQ